MSERLRPRDRWARLPISHDDHVTQLIARAPGKLVELQRLRDGLRHAVQHDQWFMVCCMCSLVGELLYAALDPTSQADMFPKLEHLRISAKKATGGRARALKRNTAYYHLAALRHTCFHPAMASPLRDLPRDLFPEMSSLHTAEAADWALEQLDLALRFELGL